MDSNQTDHVPDKTEGYDLHLAPVRWIAYKPASQQFRSGRKGRWQEMHEYGGWQNMGRAPARVYDTPELADLIEAQAARIAELEAALATARADSLREVQELIDNDFQLSCPSCATVEQQLVALIPHSTERPDP